MLAASIAQIASFLVPLSAFLAEEKEEFDPNRVTPGFGGFAVVAVLAIAVFLLGLDLVRRLRRSKYRAEIQAELAAEVAERDAAGPADAGDVAEAGVISEAGDAANAAEAPGAGPAETEGVEAERADPRPESGN